jgi:hypothetical protein
MNQFIPNNCLSELARIKTGIKSRRISSYDRSGGNRDSIPIKAKENKVICEAEGAGIINHIWMTVSPPPEQLSRNDIILRIYWDGNSFPSVLSPLGYFFGQGWNESYEFCSLPLAAGPLNGRGLVSYFAMPFSKGFRIEIENESDTDIRAFFFCIDYSEIQSLPEDTGRFSAWFNHELTSTLPEGENEWDMLGTGGNNLSGADNYVVVDIKGKGHFAGINYFVHSPTPMWYGEGDDMIFIDDEKMPALNGTGTEDYFNTAWCPKSLFTHPYYGYARVNNDIGWLGRTHIYRFHITDPVYFERSFKFTIEHGHNNCLTLDLASVAYWYQAVPLTKLPPIPGREARKPKELITLQDIHAWRHEWRKAKGNNSNLWGTEKKI